MKSIRLKLLILVLIMFSFTFLLSFGETKAIYREVKSTSLNLTVISTNDFEVRFNSNGGTTYSTRYVSPNTAVGVLPIPTKANHNFAGWYDSNGNRITHETVITADLDIYASWTEIICKRVTDENTLHKESCVSGAGCTLSGLFSGNEVITYGAVGDGVPVAGDAYDCDVDYNGIYDEKESDNKTYKERFYFVRTKTNSNTEDSAVMYYSTSYDSTGRNNRTQSKTDIGSSLYNIATGHLPQSTNNNNPSLAWDNPGLIDFDNNGTVTRFLSVDDMETVCGTLDIGHTSYFHNCNTWFWFENTRFQSKNLGRAGIWMEYDSNTGLYHRIQAEAATLGEVDVASSSNMARPVIEIPMSALEGYYDETRFTLSFTTYQGDTNIPDNLLRYRGEEVGTLPIPTRENYTFGGWYTDSGFQNAVNPTALVSGNMTLFAKWNEIPTVYVTLHLNDGEISGVNSPIALDAGDLLDNLPNPTRTGYTFEGWFTDENCTEPFDPEEPITDDMDLYALWEVIPTVQVYLHLNGGQISGVNSPITINEGDYLNNLPNPTKTGYTFAGWYTDDQFANIFDPAQPINTTTHLYARWEEDEDVAEVNGQRFTTLATAINAVPTGTSAPTTVKLLKTLELDAALSIPNNKWVELDLQNFTLSTQSDNLINNAGKLNIINGTLTSNYSGSSNGKIGYIINNTATTSVLNIYGGTLDYNNTASTEAKPIQNAKGTTNIYGGVITCNAQAATINVYGGELNVSGGQIIATGTIQKSQAIYMEAKNSTPTVNIIGDAYIKNSTVSSGSTRRAAIDNYSSGPLTITGGTIISENFYAVNNRKGGTVTIGINDSNGNVIDTTTPILQGNGDGYALNNTGSGSTANVYDGVFKAPTGAASGTINKPAGIDFTQHGTETIVVTLYKVFYLADTSGGPYTVTFDEDNGNTQSTVSGLSALDTITDNNTMPNNPTKANYVFVKWFIYKEVNNEVYDAGEFTGTTPVTDNITVMAKWKPAIGLATVSPASISIAPTETATITVTGPDDMEDYTCTSLDTNVATVSGCVVTGVAGGTTTIRIVGAESNDYQDVSVTVSGAAPVYRTVTFKKYSTDVNPYATKTVLNNGNLTGDMPTDPSVTNYEFSGWYINGNEMTPFNDTTTITGDLLVVARWKETIAYATIDTSPITLNQSSTTTITVSATIQGDEVETPTFTSSNTNVATVSSSGVITPVGPGTTTITIAGASTSKTITVTVRATVTFKKHSSDSSAYATKHVVIPGNLTGDMPTDPTETNYVFVGWYLSTNASTEFTSSSTVNSNITVIAKWNELASYADVTTSPDPFEINVGSTGTVSLTPKISGDTVESYTCTSGNDNIATVSNCTVTGVTAGTTTITITGASGETNSVSVTINAVVVSHTVTFYDDRNGSSISSVSVVHGSQIGSGNIPQNNPTKQNYVFDSWTDGTNTVDATTTVDDDLDVYPVWKETISYATLSISPNPMEIGINGTGTISLNPTTSGDEVEGYTCVSGDDNVATVSNCTITGVVVGTTTITITGNTSTATRTVSVTVSASVVSHTVHFKKETSDTTDYYTMTVNDNDYLGSLPPTNPTKTDYVFVGWYTDGPNPVKINVNVQITGDVTFYAHWEKLVCKQVPTASLHGNGLFGVEPVDGQQPEGGYAYDCDVDGTGYNKRFYYLTTDSDGYAALIYYNNVTQVNNNGVNEVQDNCNPTGLAYNSSSILAGPATAANELPTTSQWTNVSLHSTTRQIYTATGETAFGNNNLQQFSYAGKAARYATLQEIMAAAGITDYTTVGNANILSGKKFLTENTKTSDSSCGSNYWLETPYSASDIYRIDREAGSYSVGHKNGKTGTAKTRPVIEVKYYLLEDVPMLYSVSFDSTGGSIVQGKSVADDAQLGTLPANPIKQDNVFDGWYTLSSGGTEVTSTTVIHGDVTFYAHWIPSINQATFSPSNTTINLDAPNTTQITITPVADMETYSVTTSNANIASYTVSNNVITITGVGEGTATITITGDSSGDTKVYTVNVTAQIPSYTVTFDPDNNGQVTTITNVTEGTLLSTLIPSTDPTKSNYTFDNWYVFENNVWDGTEDVIDPTATVTSDLNFKASYYTSSDVAAIGRSYYTNLALAIMAAPEIQDPSDPETEIRIINNISNITCNTTTHAGVCPKNGRTMVPSTKKIAISAIGHTVECGNSTNGNVIYVEGSLRIKNGTFTCGTKAGIATLEANAGATIYIDGGTISNTNNRGAIYNNGTVYINDGAISTSASVTLRSTIQNNSGASIIMSGGTVTQLATTYSSDNNGNGRGAIKIASGATGVITGGTITSLSTQAGAIYNQGTLTIGVEDTTNHTYDATTPVIQGDQFGIESTNNYSVYDGIIKGKGNNDSNNPVLQAVDYSKITGTETGSTRVTGQDGDYYTLYYEVAGAPTPTPTPTPVPSTYTIVLNAHGGSFGGNASTSSKEFNCGATITASDLLPEPTNGIYTFDGWYTDSSASNSPVSFPYTIPSVTGSTTFYAKWTYVASNEIVDVNTLSDALQTYFANINTWKNGTESQLTNNLSSTFSTNSCSTCNGANTCTQRGSGTYCEQPKGYDTGMNSAVSVYLSDAVNKQKGASATHVTSVNGVLYNLIPGQVYYWELDSDPTVHGLVRATETRRTIYSTVGNVRDLGGMQVSYEEDGHTVTGTIDYGRLYRGAQLSSSQSDVTNLAQLGITREIDLRSTSEANQNYTPATFTNYDVTGGSNDPVSQNSKDIVIENYLINYDTVSYTYTHGGTTYYSVSDHSTNAVALKDAMIAIMKYVINSNDNIYFHCTIGTDRTGTIAYFLEGLLGASEEDRVEDYEMTYFYGLANRTRYHDDLTSTQKYPRFKFMHTTYPTNAAIYAWFTHGDTQAEKETDDALITAFRNAMIVNKVTN